MRFEISIPSFFSWEEERSVGARSANITVTRRGTTVAIRLVRGTRKARWARTFNTSVLAELANLRIARTLKLAGYTVLDGEDIKIPSPDPLQHWKDECTGREGDDARLVYADFLTERRDPRGELIVAQAAAENDDAMAILKAERLIMQNRSTFLGPFDDRPGLYAWRRGYVDSFIAERAAREYAYDFDLSALLVASLTHASGELIRDLTLGLHAESSQFAPNATASEPVAILTALAPPSVEVLTLQRASTSFTTPRIGEITPLFAAMPRLQNLTANGNEIAFTPFIAPRLTDLTLEGTVNDASLEALAMSTCPLLEHVRIKSLVSSNSAATLEQVFGSRLTLDRR